MSMPPEGRAVVEKAMRLAGILLGPGASDGQKVAFIAATYLSAHRRPGEGR